MAVPCQSFISLHDVTGTYLEYLVDRLCVSMMSCGLIGSDLSFVFCLNYVSLGMSCQSSICFMMRWFLIGSLLSIVYLSSICHGYSLGVPYQLSICFHDAKGTHWGVMSIGLLSR